MCGITGAIWTDPKRAIDSPTLRAMTDVIRHRGPDDEGSYVSEFRLRPPYEPMPGVALGFRRLSIIDLEGGHQPMSNEDGSVWVVFNGEIYNYAALRRRLDGAGHTFRTSSDTETIVHLYEDEGLDFVQHLNGMFAIAIWDSRQRRLVLARDRIGQKPLVYRHEPGRLLFSSELKSLLQVPGVPREIDAGAIDDYLTYQYIPHPKTIFRGIRKLPPGHLAIFEGGEMEVRPYWQPNLNDELRVSASEASCRLVELINSSVEMRMRSDVPLGAFLSGGVDSSLIVALMQQRTSQPIKTFTIGFPIAEYDETSYAQQVARHLGTDHEELQVAPDAVSILPKLVWNYDEPFADSSAIPTWYVSEMTRRHVTVALSGDGGDELFAGYPRYKAVWLASHFDQLGPLRSFLAAGIWQRIPGSRQKSLVRRFKRFSEFLGKTPQRRYLEWIAIYHESRRAAMFRDDFVERLPNDDPFSFLGNAWGRASRRDLVTGASLADLTTYLPCDLMTKVDIASMAHSLEVRQPFLDYRVVEYAAALPLSLKFRRGTGKLLLRRAFGDLLPPAIWNRRKMGFGVPLEHWFRNELRELTHDTLLSESARINGWFRREYVQQLVSEHESKQFDHAYRLWALLVLELWSREWCPE
ncbi:MAG: asparagine synthase (glutamine-hydrolyzing) [Planctomycetaceae bacterium]|nr:asparagine synthase (glutamine-hydrolyzing) [Planctomycetales bacterium]MCB9927119.1 asparagine synthase (glutamine-hydrolyzing) [Planctomycetaceae bacterium]